MMKTIAHRAALVVALTFLSAPVSQMYGQGLSVTSPSAVTGGDPQPTGEPTPKKNAIVAFPAGLLAILAVLGLA